MKKTFVFLAIISSIFLSQNVLADSKIDLKRSCLKKNPLVVDETDPILLGIYAQACDTKNEDNKNAYLVLAAQRFQQLDKDQKALELVNHLQSQHVQSATLTDTKFLAASKIANSAIHDMRTQEMRYLTSDVTYPIAKELANSINQAKPIAVIAASTHVGSSTEAISSQSTKHKSVKKSSRAKAVAKTSAKTVKENESKPATTNTGSKASSSNPFAGL